MNEHTPSRKKGQPTAEELLADLNKPLPQSKESEQSVLSSLLQDPSRLRHARLKARPEAFYHADTRQAYVELLTMDEEGVPIDPVMMTNRLRDQGKLDLVGGPAGISELFTFVPSAAHYAFYMDDLIGRWKLRQVIHGHALALRGLLDHLAGAGAAADAESIQGAVNLAGQTVQAFLAGQEHTGNTTATLADCLHEHMDHMISIQAKADAGGPVLIPTGIPRLDAVAGGIAEDEYWLITGPTKSGKSVTAGCFVKSAAYKGFKSKVYTNEIQRRTYAGRFIVSEGTQYLTGSIERLGLRSKGEQDEYQSALRKIQENIGKLVKIDNAAGKYVEDIVADIRQEAQAGVKLFVVDLIGKLRARRTFQSRELEVAYCSGSLCDATKNFGVAIIVVAQENNDGETRESKSLAMDCEAWIKVQHVINRPEKKRGGFSAPSAPVEDEIVRDRRDLVVQVARGFASGERIPCYFDGSRFLIRELTKEDSANQHWNDNL